MKFSIIIVNYNTAQITTNCINSLLPYKEKENLEIIVVDNSSQDDSYNIIKNTFKEKIKIIKNKKNLGFATANNIGVNLAQGKYLFFLNSDTIIDYNIFPDIIKIFKNNSNLGVLAPQLIDENRIPYIKDYGSYPKIKDLIINKLQKKEKNTQQKQPIKVDWVSGAAIIIPKEIFQEVQGWDEKFFMYFEDIDLCKRIKKEGYQIIINPQIKLIHLGGKSINKSKTRKKYYYQSQNYYFKKHHGIFSLLILKLIRLPYKFIMLRK